MIIFIFTIIYKLFFIIISERNVNSETLVFSCASSDSDDSDEIEEQLSKTILAEEVIEQPKLFQLRGKTNFITDKMAAAFNRCKACFPRSVARREVRYSLYDTRVVGSVMPGAAWCIRSRRLSVFVTRA